jgi:hypothetical protein
MRRPGLARLVGVAERMAGDTLAIALRSGAGYGAIALLGSAATAWLSPWMVPGGRLFGVVVFTLASAGLGIAYARHYGRPGAVTWIPWRVGGVAALVTVFVWGYGHAWLLEPGGSRISILSPLAGLLRGVRFTGALLLSAAPVLVPGWWIVHRGLSREAARPR